MYKGREFAPTQPRRSVKRVQRVEDSLAQVWGAQPQRTPSGKYSKTNALHKSAQSLRRQPCFPRSRQPRRDRLQETAKPEVNLQRPITTPMLRERTKAISTCGIETQDVASRPVCRNAANSRREPRQSATAETRDCARNEGNLSPEPQPRARTERKFPSEPQRWT